MSLLLAFLLLVGSAAIALLLSLDAAFRRFGLGEQTIDLHSPGVSAGGTLTQTAVRLTPEATLDPETRQRMRQLMYLCAALALVLLLFG